MKKIYLIDPNQKYAIKLQKQLNPKLKPIAKIELLISPAELKEDFALAIIHASYYFDHRYEYQLKKFENLKTIRLIDGTNRLNQQSSTAETTESDYSVLSRKATVKVWLHQILYRLNKIEQQIEIEQNQVHLLFTFNQHIRHVFLQKWVLEQNTDGNKIFILPIKPLYLWNYQADFHAGPNLSDLILQIEQDIEISEKDLGLIFEKQKSGVFLSRGNSTADDVFAYKHQSLQTIGTLFKKFIVQHEKNSSGLIDVEARPFHLVKDLASVCDVCHFDLGKEDNYGMRIAKTEIATFLAKKSPTVKFEPIVLDKSFELIAFKKSLVPTTLKKLQI